MFLSWSCSRSRHWTFGEVFSIPFDGGVLGFGAPVGVWDVSVQMCSRYGKVRMFTSVNF